MNEEMTRQLAIVALCDFPELIPPLYIMPKHIRDRAKNCDEQLTEQLLDLDPYLARLWFVCSDKRSGNKKMGWIVNHHKKLKNVYDLRPNILNELWNQVELGYISGSSVADIFAQIDEEKTIGHIAYDLGLYSSIDIELTVRQSIMDNLKAAQDYLAGETKALGPILATIKRSGVSDMKNAQELTKSLIQEIEVDG